MSERVTDFRIDRYEIPADMYYSLPDKTRRMLEIYGKPIQSESAGVYVFEVAAYRLPEILATLPEKAEP